jgi:hypothetical protein
MNQYEMTANSYREVIEKKGDTLPKEVIQSLEREIKALDIVARLDDLEIKMLFDTGAFNEIVKAYFKKAMEMHDMSKDEMGDIIRNLAYLFDTQKAAEL